MAAGVKGLFGNLNFNSQRKVRVPSTCNEFVSTLTFDWDLKSKTTSRSEYSRTLYGSSCKVRASNQQTKDAVKCINYYFVLFVSGRGT